MESAAPRPHIRAAVWLGVLGTFFFASYNSANAYAASLDHVPSIMFGWERRLPFLGWTILPYWSCDVLYAASLFLCRTREGLDRHAWRLLAIQVFSVACFFVFPLRQSWVRPPLEGLDGWFFDLLARFDQSFNQAPSLHVSLAVILWVCYRQFLTGWVRTIAAAWFILIAVSAWTTYQHHFIDLPLGVWAALLVIAAIPERRFADARRPKLAAFYFLPALALACAAFIWRGALWLALWPASSLSMVACAYWTGDPVWLAKRRNGRIGFWMWPYTLCAWINSRCWTRGEEPWQHLVDGVWVGRAPSPWARFATVIDLTAEMPVHAQHHIPILDLTVPDNDQVMEAVDAIMAAERPALVCCALGYSRSATVAAAWLVAAGHVASAEEAIAKVRLARPRVVLGKEAEQRVQACARLAANQ
ncbi:MAG: dual specificity protein phosphatase family protein [Acidobacteriota bacterium]